MDPIGYTPLEYLFEKFEIFANGDKIQVGVKAEDVNPAPRTASVEDDSVGTVCDHGRKLAREREGVGRRSAGGHEKKYKSDEK